MAEAVRVQDYRESKIEDEPILGPVLCLPDGRIQQLTWLEKLLLKLRLTNVKALEARYYRPSGA